MQHTEPDFHLIAPRGIGRGLHHRRRDRSVLRRDPWRQLLRGMRRLSIQDQHWARRRLPTDRLRQQHRRQNVLEVHETLACRVPSDHPPLRHPPPGDQLPGAPLVGTQRLAQRHPGYRGVGRRDRFPRLGRGCFVTLPHPGILRPHDAGAGVWRRTRASATWPGHRYAATSDSARGAGAPHATSLRPCRARPGHPDTWPQRVAPVWPDSLAPMAHPAGVAADRPWLSPAPARQGKNAGVRPTVVHHPGSGSSLSRVEFLGEMSDVLHSRAPLALIPPTPFSHKGRRGSLIVLMAETGDGTQGLAKKSTPVRWVSVQRLRHVCTMRSEAPTAWAIG